MISGYQQTPTLAATKSPKLRVIANPGPFASFSHTRSGPTLLPNLVNILTLGILKWIDSSLAANNPVCF